MCLAFKAYPEQREEAAVEATLTLLRGRRSVEIGGPSMFAGSLYRAIAGDDLDRTGSSDLFTNIAYPLSPCTDGEGYDYTSSLTDNTAFHGPFEWHLGNTLVRHGAHLHGIKNSSVGVVFASHNLEHYVDPIAALLEWDRILEPGGNLVLILPFGPKTYDSGRTLATTQELLWIHNSIKEFGESEAERILAFRTENFVRSFDVDFSEDPFDIKRAGPQQSMQQDLLRKRLLTRCPYVSLGDIAQTGIGGDISSVLDRQCSCRPEASSSKEVSLSSRGDADRNNYSTHLEKNLVDESLVHWHVFDFGLLLELVEGCFGYKVLMTDFQEPFHQIVIARKPDNR